MPRLNPEDWLVQISLGAFLLNLPIPCVFHRVQHLAFLIELFLHVLELFLDVRCWLIPRLLLIHHLEHVGLATCHLV